MPNMLFQANLGARIRVWDGERIRYEHIPFDATELEVLSNHREKINERSVIWKNSLASDEKYSPFMRYMHCRSWSDDAINSAVLEQLLLGDSNLDGDEMVRFFRNPVDPNIVSQGLWGILQSRFDDPSGVQNTIESRMNRPGMQHLLERTIELVTRSHAEWFYEWYKSNYYRKSLAAIYSLPDFYLYTLFRADHLVLYWSKFLEPFIDDIKESDPREGLPCLR